MTTPAAPSSTVPGTEPAGARADLAQLTGRTRLPPALANASGMQKLDWIIGQPDPEAFVRELAPQELYYWIRDIGKGDASALIELADREQKRALIDIDAWSRHELQLPRWLEWLDLAEVAGDDTALDFVSAQDDETLEWLFSGDVTVHPADHDLDTVPDDLAAFHSPDGMYLVTVPREHELEERLPRLMKLLWAADEDRARTLLQQVQFELRSNIVSDMERFRDARVQDLGFEPQTEALVVWATLPVNALRDSLRRGQTPDELAPRGPAEVSGLVTDLVLRDVPAPELLAEALQRMVPDDRARVGEALAYLVNKVFVAETGDLSRLDDLPITARHTAALVNLGLEHVADGSVEHAARVLGQVSPEVLFRAGNTLTVELGRRARKVRERAGAALGLSLLGTPSDEVLHGLALLRPLCFEGLDSPGRQGYRAFATLDELARAEVRVADAEALLGFFEARFGFTPAAVTALPLPADVLARVRLATLFRTALAWTILRDEPAFEPLGRDELAAFARAAFERRGAAVALAAPLQRLVDGLASAAASGTGAASEAVATFVRRALDELVDAVGGVRPDDLDPRFTGELFLVREA